MNEEIYQRLMSMMGKQNPYDGKEIHQNSTYNDLVFCFFHFYHKLGETALKPNVLPSLEAITRTIRDLPLREKNLKEEARYHKYYAEKYTK